MVECPPRRTHALGLGPRSAGRHPDRRLTPTPLNWKINRKSGDPEAPLTVKEPERSVHRLYIRADRDNPLLGEFQIAGKLGSFVFECGKDVWFCHDRLASEGRTRYIGLMEPG